MSGEAGRRTGWRRGGFQGGLGRSFPRYSCLFSPAPLPLPGPHSGTAGDAADESKAGICLSFPGSLGLAPALSPAPKLVSVESQPSIPTLPQDGTSVLPHPSGVGVRGDKRVAINNNQSWKISLAYFGWWRGLCRGPRGVPDFWQESGNWNHIF